MFEWYFWKGLYFYISNCIIFKENLKAVVILW
jgi:hypothetical protein